MTSSSGHGCVLTMGQQFKFWLVMQAPLLSILFLEVFWDYILSSVDDVNLSYCFMDLLYYWLNSSNGWDTFDWEANYSSEEVHFLCCTHLPMLACMSLLSCPVCFHPTAKVLAIRQQEDSVRVFFLFLVICAPGNYRKQNCCLSKVVSLSDTARMKICRVCTKCT